MVTDTINAADNTRFAGQIGMMRFALLTKKQPDPSHIEISHGEEIFKVAVKRRPAARRVTLRISNATGEIVLTLPEKMSLATAQRFAESYGGWIATRVRKVPDRVAFEMGALIPIRGEPHRIMRPYGAYIKTGIFQCADDSRIIVVSGENSHVARRVKELLMRAARHDLEKAVAHYTQKLNVTAQKLTLRDTKSRWGSCSSRGSLSFSWRLIMAPAYVLDYLAAHEVGHLMEMNHSHRFWRIVNDLCPHVEEAEKWLKHNGSSLHRYG